jgi:hypothetical protein
MFMSYPAINHVEVKIEPAAGGCKVVLRHRAIGMIDPEHRKNIERRLEPHAQPNKKGLRVGVTEIAARPADELDPVWKALSDPTRRAILDFLRERPAPPQKLWSLSAP